MANLDINFKHYSSGFLIPVLVIVFLGAGYFFIWPQFQNVQDKQESLDAVRADRDAAQTNLEGIRQLLVDYDDKQPDLEELDKSIPSSASVPELLANLENLVQQSSLSITSLNVTLPDLIAGASGAADDSEQGVGSADLTTITIDLGLQGEYPGLKAFLENLENNIRLFDISDVVVSNTEVTGPQEGSQTYSLKIDTYYQGSNR